MSGNDSAADVYNPSIERQDWPRSGRPQQFGRVSAFWPQPDMHKYIHDLVKGICLRQPALILE